MKGSINVTNTVSEPAWLLATSTKVRLAGSAADPGGEMFNYPKSSITEVTIKHANASLPARAHGEWT